VSDRGLPIADGADACPFVAFEDDRDERASVPDHRHRCYAEAQPAPRALAHQEAYCLSSAFPVCPTFQDWARRESARTRGGEPVRPTPASIEAPMAAAAMSAPEPGDEAAAGADDSAHAGAADAGEDLPPDAPPPRHDDDGEVRRNPHRDWSAPPPWLASAEGAAGAAAASEPPLFLASRSQPGQGLAGSAADQLAGGPPPTRPPQSADAGSQAAWPAAGSTVAGAAGAGAAAGGAASAGRAPARDSGTHPDDVDFEARDLPRPATPRRPRAYDQHLGGPSSGPDWERPRRYEAYPTIRTRVGIPPIPRLAVMAAAIGIAALALFFLPAILGLGGGNQASSSPSPSTAPSRSVEPTAAPAPTPIVYTIKPGDTLTKIATANGLTLAEIMAANPDIKDPNKIVVGQNIIIPVPQPSAPTTIGSAAPSGGAAP
jgi:LysM domain